MPAHLVTNNTIEVGRNSSCPRVIAHYLQPHVPFLFHSDEGRDNINLHSMSKQNKDFWKHDGVFWELIRGNISRQELVTRFTFNLEYVMDEIELLLENFEADEVVITSDHGNAFDERFLYQHPIYVEAEAVKAVPWVETRGNDTKSLTNIDTSPAQQSSLSKEEKLAVLGYY